MMNTHPMTHQSEPEKRRATAPTDALRVALTVLAFSAFAASALASEPALRGLRTGEGELRPAVEPLVMQHPPAAFVDDMMSGGPPPDGIPSIDDPRFISATEADLDDGDKVIGLTYNDVVRAYPQNILVYHEIVNDTVAGERVAITYCPLTATAQAFRTGTTTLGVSGLLVNSNLVMYDRETGSLWPQITATAVAGERKGESLDEIDVVWTTWGQWRERHPTTEVLSTHTGIARDYNRDPYGSYNPDSGYYSSSRVMFPVMHRDRDLPAKHPVAGARTQEQAVFFDLETLARVGVQRTGHFLGVYDDSLGIAHIYRSAGDGGFTSRGGEVLQEDTGETFAPDALPLEAVTAIEAFYFAWNAFYPNSESP